MTRKTILLVEDNPDDADLTLRAFKRHGIANEAVVASDGEDALDYLFAKGRTCRPRSGHEPDARAPGSEAAQGFRTRGARAHASRRAHTPRPRRGAHLEQRERDIITSYDLGANSFARKPVDSSQFIDAARQLGLYWLVLNEAPGARV